MQSVCCASAEITEKWETYYGQGILFHHSLLPALVIMTLFFLNHLLATCPFHIQNPDRTSNGKIIQRMANN
jgi:hypothetical protein